jgi:hypothetical protein
VGTKSLLGAACCGLAIAIAGCALAGCGGGNERLAAPAYAREASKLCRRGNLAVARVQIPPLTPPHGASTAASRAMARIVVVQRDTIDDLRNVRPPEQLNGTVQKWIALLDQGTDELEAMSVHLRAGRTDVALEYGAKATTLLDRARELMAPLRVTSCRGPVLPTV